MNMVPDILRYLSTPMSPKTARILFYLFYAMMGQMIPVFQSATEYKGWPDQYAVATAMMIGLYQGMGSIKALYETPPLPV